MHNLRLSEAIQQLHIDCMQSQREAPFDPIFNEIERSRSSLSQLTFSIAWKFSYSQTWWSTTVRKCLHVLTIYAAIFSSVKLHSDNRRFVIAWPWSSIRDFLLQHTFVCVASILVASEQQQISPTTLMNCPRGKKKEAAEVYWILMRITQKHYRILLPSTTNNCCMKHKTVRESRQNDEWTSGIEAEPRTNF